ncbi:DNA polymerase III subunit gamma/tau [Enterobacteriaceae endosymbiont of Neohaemonia nigricornis]|uniref:DNA polymerase III subunit gamma/tau n=1 Tax=Enterobacteriaceae endosymbiont of Neohaemonia nigricornis TaxID=2675792 RepID=UPI00144A217A|nr:DNA polymerase III subunit gamma/tau [Enterobacteriaceae endosymbiont of Neohaemonia nigricornis]QJC30524.1 DNA polymerase III subunit gamma/tau [Enterobacteriaceae endosymbiont of Neohaemonia nigricornis]
MTYTVLARKWRPQSFNDVIGQDHIIQAMKYSLLTNKIHHAWILSGSRGIGKTTLARIFAMGLNCKKGLTNNPCNCCTNCKDIQNNVFLDVIELDSAFKTKVEDMRDIIDTIHYPPLYGRYKVYIFDEFHMLSKHSFNALLKILEEPPKNVQFIFATTELNKIPITIQSRCIQFHLKLIESNLIIKRLKQILDIEKLSYDNQILPILSNASYGSFRDALNLTDQLIAMGHLNINNLNLILGLIENKYIFQLVFSLKQKNYNQSFLLINKICIYNINWDNIISEILLLLHNVLKYKILYSQHNKFNIDNSIQCNKEEIYIKKICDNFSLNDINMLNKIFIVGRKNLCLAPTCQIGFEQIILEAISCFN